MHINITSFNFVHNNILEMNGLIDRKRDELGMYNFERKEGQNKDAF